MYVISALPLFACKTFQNKPLSMALSFMHHTWVLMDDERIEEKGI